MELLGGKVEKNQYKYFVLMPNVLKFKKENGKMAAKPPVISLQTKLTQHY